jgi:cardiolipin synthase
MNLRWLPNGICVMRMLLAIPVSHALMHAEYGLAIWLFLLAAVSDGLDGWLAKRFQWTSHLGKILDPIADKLLVVAVFACLVLTGLVPVWLAFTVVLRDVVIVSGATAYHYLVGGLEGRPTRVSKINTVVQLMFISVVILQAGWRMVPHWTVDMIGAASFVTTVVSGIDYVLTYSRLALHERRRLHGLRPS